MKNKTKYKVVLSIIFYAVLIVGWSLFGNWYQSNSLYVPGTEKLEADNGEAFVVCSNENLSYNGSKIDYNGSLNYAETETEDFASIGVFVGLVILTVLSFIGIFVTLILLVELYEYAGRLDKKSE